MSPAQAPAVERTAERRLVVVAPMAVHPPRRGGQVRVAGLLANLGHGWRVDLFTQVIQRTDLPWPRSQIVVSQLVTEHRMRDPLSLVWMRALAALGYPPVFENEFLSLFPRRLLRRALATASVVLVSHPYQVRWVRAATPESTSIVMDAQNLEGLLYRPRRTPWSKWLAAAVARSEREAWHLVDLAFACTDDDAAVMRGDGVAAVVVVPNATDLGRYRPSTPGHRAARRHALGLPGEGTLAVFVGSAHPPNTEAVDVLERQAAAYAAAGVGLVVVGRVGSRRRPTSNMIFAGEVADVVPWLEAADIAVNPMLSGGGSSLKMMEYLAAGLPVVTTEVGARGLDLSAGIEAELCDVDSMPAVVERLVADPVRLGAIARQARLAAEAKFGWAASGRVAAEALARLADSPR